MPGMKNVALAAALTAALLGAGCTVGPKYQRPAATVPEAVLPPQWKGEPWKAADPKDAIPRGSWWAIFQDPQLDAYEDQLLKSNQTLAAGRSHLEQARALARVATAAAFPQLSVDPSAQRAGMGSNRPLSGGTTPTSYTQNIFALPFDISYEADLFGRVRRQIEAGNSSLQAAAGDLENTRLVLTSELAADYFSLRELDAETKVVAESVEDQRKALELVRHRHDGGIANGLELAQQASLLDATRTQLELVEQSRAQYEHAIAALVGQPAASFSVAMAPLRDEPPAVPLGVPADLLQRRPDIAYAERQVAYQNAQVGLAHAAFYPRITISSDAGLESRTFTSLIGVPSFIWGMGIDALEPVFQGGRNRANLAASRASYDASVATYRQSVLDGIQQVEDGLSNLKTLSQAAATQAAAVEDSRKELEIANHRYIGGVTTYLDVISAETTLLTNQRLAVQLLGQRLVNTVYLVKALGGGWDARDLENLQVKPQWKQAVQQ
ncbi:MAG: efflux transporter outer membrane subunit [Acidobacteriota bacterium]|nr:efflux transporter outer membrane subunit [Acidobacteriota bacterium]